MKKEGSRNSQRIDSVQNPTMPGNRTSCIFNPYISLNRGHNHISDETDNSNEDKKQTVVTDVSEIILDWYAQKTPNQDFTIRRSYIFPD